MNNDIKINMEDIREDLLMTYYYLLYKARNCDYFLNINGFNSLNKNFYLNYGYILDDSLLYNYKPEIRTKVNSKIDKSRMKFYKYFFDNYELLLKISGNYNELLNEIKQVTVPFTNCIRHYSSKDFKDLILSFYSKFDSNIYNVVKKYFDENRINMDSNVEEDVQAFYTGINILKSGYIFSKDNQYNSSSASYLVHELGHAVDAELFLFPQSKNLSIFEDKFLEIPSTCFETLFLNYLIDEHIDEDGGLVLSSGRYSGIDNHFQEMEKCFFADNLLVDDYGNIIADNEYINLRESFLYGIGYYISNYFYEIYKNDPKEFNKIFYNFISSRKEASFEELINILGFDIDEFCNCDVIKKTLDEKNTKLKKRFHFEF